MNQRVGMALAAALVLASSSTWADEKAKREFVHEANVMSRSADDGPDDDAESTRNKDVGPVRWMAPESVRDGKTPSAQQSKPVPRQAADPQRGHKTDKDKAKRSDASAPCPALPPDDTNTGNDESAPAPETGKAQGCN